MASPSGKRTSGPILKFEPEGVALLESCPTYSRLFNEKGWHEYCERLTGYHVEVTRAFAWSFDGQKVEFKTLTLQVTEESITEATRLYVEGDKWFKRLSLKPFEYNHLLVWEHKDPNWEKGSSSVWVKPKYTDSLYLIHKYITCEGRFSLIFLYHLRLLSHLVDDQKLSLPYYFHKSLVKMAMKWKNPGMILDSYLFHHGLVKLLVHHALRKM